jgi:endo-1,4-beta-xylanase
MANDGLPTTDPRRLTTEDTVANRLQESARYPLLAPAPAPVIVRPVPARSGARSFIAVAIGMLIVLSTLAVAAIVIERRGYTGPADKPPAAKVGVGQPTLRQFAARRGITIGTAVQSRAFREDATYRALLADEFDGLTFENQLKWDVVEPQRGRYEWGNADALVSFAQQQGIALRGHTLVWSSALPGWLTTSAFTRDQLRAILRDHIYAVVGRYRGRVAAWDVVNEPLDSSGQLGRSFWYQALGADYLADALRWAHEADPKAALYINDFGVENRNRKSDGLYQLVSTLRQAGVPINGVGFQSHLTVDSPLATLEENLSRFTELGLDVAITELDVRLPRPVTENLRVMAANVYAKVLRDCLAVRRCVSYTVWGFSDSYSWVPYAYPGWGEACLYDATFGPKPAYLRVRDVLAAPPPGG